MYPPKLNQATILVPLTILLMASGCKDNENRRLADFAAESNQRQAEQNRQMAHLQQEMVQGTRRLVESEADARGRFVELRREIQSASNEVAVQRDKVEQERKDLAAERRTAPIVAAAIMSVGTVVACLLPIVLGIYLLATSHDGATDQLLAETLIEDLVAPVPRLFAAPKLPRLVAPEPSQAAIDSEPPV